MDCLLVNPGNYRPDYITEHLGIASLKAYLLSGGFEVDTLDMAIEEKTVAEVSQWVNQMSPVLLGISLLDDTRDRGLALIKAVREAGYGGKIGVGGYFPTFASREILQDFPEIDFVVRGEGEETLLELVGLLKQGGRSSCSTVLGLSYREGELVTENPSRPLIGDLDRLPPVDRKYARRVLSSGSHLRVYATRGCWGRCSFCDIIGFYRSSPGKVWRARSIEQVVDELEQLVNTYHTDIFVFNDDQFLLPGKRSLERVEAFAGEIERRRLKIKFELMCRADVIVPRVMVRLQSVGLQRVFLGVESFEPGQLVFYNKGISWRQNIRAIIYLSKMKLDMVVSVILTNASTTLRDLIRQFIWLSEVKRRYFQGPNCMISVNHKLEVYRGSGVYHYYRKQGWLTRDHYLTGYTYRLKFFTNLRLQLFIWESRIGRLIFKPAAVWKNVKWRISRILKGNG